MGPRQHDVIARHGDTLAITVPDGPGEPLDPAGLFGRTAPVVLEIGSGMGETAVAQATADPGRDYLAVEVHTPGIASLLDQVATAGLGNVRVVRGDALELLRHRLAPESLAAIHVYFPDPWPKSRHHKRRIIQPAHTGLLASRLVPGGVLHCATDWPAYAEAMLAALRAEPLLENTVDGYASRPDDRPVTRFERRGLTAGRPIADLIFRRRTS
jgi:tRNA (guanine-N7-)-methyltransferase